MKLPDTIVTHRLTLRPMRPTDAGVLAGIMRDPRLAEVMTEVPEGRDDQIATANTFTATVRPNHWMICRNERAIGWISLDPVLSLVLAPDARMSGYGDEAAYAVLSAASDAGVTLFRAGHHQENAASQRMLERLGMACDGFLKVTRHGGRQEVFRRVAVTADRFDASRKTRIKTARLELSPLLNTDAAEVSRMISPMAVARMLGSVTSPQSEAATAKRIAARRFFDRPGFALAIRLSGKVIGEVGLGPSPVSFYYWLGEDHMGKGFATEAGHAFVAYMMPRLGLNEIVADSFTDNPKSIHVLQKLGFQETGTGVGTSRARVGEHPIREFRLTLDAFNAKRAA